MLCLSYLFIGPFLLPSPHPLSPTPLSALFLTPPYPSFLTIPRRHFSLFSFLFSRLSVPRTSIPIPMGTHPPHPWTLDLRYSAPGNDTSLRCTGGRSCSLRNLASYTHYTVSLCAMSSTYSVTREKEEINRRNK